MAMQFVSAVVSFSSFWYGGSGQDTMRLYIWVVAVAGKVRIGSGDCVVGFE